MKSEGKCWWAVWEEEEEEEEAPGVKSQWMWRHHDAKHMNVIDRRVEVGFPNAVRLNAGLRYVTPINDKLNTGQADAAEINTHTHTLWHIYVGWMHTHKHNPTYIIDLFYSHSQHTALSMWVCVCLCACVCTQRLWGKMTCLFYHISRLMLIHPADP